MSPEQTSPTPDDPDWVPSRLAELVEELEALPRFVPGLKTESDVRRTL